MGSWLYLDTARLGQMSPAAQRAQQDFSRLASEAPGAIQVEDFLRDGFEALDAAIREQLPGLATWPGIARFKRSLRHLAGFQDDLPLLLASRSSELMKLAAIVLSQLCRNILITDLGWPNYQRILEAECERTQRHITTLRLADDVLRGRINAEEVIERVRGEYLRQACDGLFLTAISNTGARLPVQAIVQAVGDACRFVVVDGAQDFCHAGWNGTQECCDLYLAGCHKWLGGYHPLGVACYGRRRSRSIIDTVLNELLTDRQVDDPLLRFLAALQQGGQDHFGETINLSPLFSSAGAVQDANRDDADQCFKARLSNAEYVAAVAASSKWTPLVPDMSLRSGIVMLEGSTTEARNASSDELRRGFQQLGVILSAYEGGGLRLSMPASPFEPRQLEQLSAGLRNLA